jgi:hypothetical protein
MVPKNHDEAGCRLWVKMRNARTEQMFFSFNSDNGHPAAAPQ